MFPASGAIWRLLCAIVRGVSAPVFVGGGAYRRLHCLRFAYRLTLRQSDLWEWRHRRIDKREVLSN